MSLARALLRPPGRVDRLDCPIAGYDRASAPAIALPKAEHEVIPNLRGSYTGSPSDLVERDIRNLRSYTDAPDSAIHDLLGLIAKSYPGQT